MLCYVIQRVIRGSGLAYGASVSCDAEAGQTSFSLYRVRVHSPSLST